MSCLWSAVQVLRRHVWLTVQLDDVLDPTVPKMTRPLVGQQCVESKSKSATCVCRESSLSLSQSQSVSRCEADSVNIDFSQTLTDTH